MVIARRIVLAIFVPAATSSTMVSILSNPLQYPPNYVVAFLRRTGVGWLTTLMVVCVHVVLALPFKLKL
jgi:hypothetical protein